MESSPDTLAERLLPARAQPVVAAAAGMALIGMAAWYVVAGGLRGSLVDHDHPPEVALAFTVDVNGAGEAELAQLPGVGPALARRIVERRVGRGPFARADELLDVPGIGPVTLERIRPHLRPFWPGDGPPPEEASP